MSSSGMLRRVALVRTDVSEERIASIISVTRIVELGTTLAVTSNRSTLQKVLTRTTRPNIPGNGILYNYSTFQELYVVSSLYENYGITVTKVRDNK
jgi:hypothetical protein